MASAMRVFRKFRASDGRIKIATLSGVSALVAVIAMLVGVLPVMADHDENDPDAGHPLVVGVQVDWGGGEGACDDALISLEGDDEGDARGPSAAEHSAHLQNPKVGDNVIFGDDPNDTKITITVHEDSDKLFDFSIDSDHFRAYDVVVNGGKKSNHYEYDGSESGITPSKDFDLSAPTKDNKDELHNLSHINICYDVQPVEFECDAKDPTHALDFGDGSFDGATATIFANSVVTKCDDKSGRFFIDGDEATLDFGTDDGVLVAGRADFTKSFNSPTDPTDNFEDLEYDPDADGANFVDVEWCNIRDAEKDDGTQFEDVLGTDLYPSLLNADDSPLQDAAGDATACKVAEIENADGVQVTVVYFEFEDPQFQ